MIKLVYATVLATCLLGCKSVSTSASVDGPYQTTGIKICEVTRDSAIIWTRLCAKAERVNQPKALPQVSYLKEKDGKKLGWPFEIPVVTYADGITIDTLDGAVPGMTGEVQVWYRIDGQKEWSKTTWHAVKPKTDYTAQARLSSLISGKTYAIEVHCRKDNTSSAGQVVTGRFKTAPVADAEAAVSFMVVTGQRYPKIDMPGLGFKSYDAMLKLDPDFFVHTGDILYYDQYAMSVPLAHWHWQRMYSLPTNVRFHKQVASYFEKDDHDTLCNDTWSTCNWNKRQGDLTFEDGIRIFKEQVGMGKKTYRTVRWGKHLQIWFVEGRDFRSSNKAEDGLEKTIWGAEQKAWFKKTVKESDATFRVLISPTPVVGPDRKSKGDNHSNPNFATEGDELREFISSQKNMVVVCGDRHWQYVSKDKETGLIEYSCGPLSDEHAGGWRGGRKNAEHLYLNVCGGFFNGNVEIRESKPVLVMRHYSPEGALLNEDIREVQ